MAIINKADFTFVSSPGGTGASAWVGNVGAKHPAAPGDRGCRTTIPAGVGASATATEGLSVAAQGTLTTYVKLPTTPFAAIAHIFGRRFITPITDVNPFYVGSTFVKGVVGRASTNLYVVLNEDFTTIPIYKANDAIDRDYLNVRLIYADHPDDNTFVLYRLERFNEKYGFWQFCTQNEFSKAAIDSFFLNFGSQPGKSGLACTNFSGTPQNVDWDESEFDDTPPDLSFGNILGTGEHKSDFETTLADAHRQVSVNAFNTLNDTSTFIPAIAAGARPGADIGDSQVLRLSGTITDISSSEYGLIYKPYRVRHGLNQAGLNYIETEIWFTAPAASVNPTLDQHLFSFALANDTFVNNDRTLDYKINITLNTTLSQITLLELQRTSSVSAPILATSTATPLPYVAGQWIGLRLRMTYNATNAAPTFTADYAINTGTFTNIPEFSIAAPDLVFPIVQVISSWFETIPIPNGDFEGVVEVGQTITVTGSTNGNDGTYTVTNVSGNQLQVTPVPPSGSGVGSGNINVVDCVAKRKSWFPFFQYQFLGDLGEAFTLDIDDYTIRQG